MASHARTLVGNQHHNGHPDLVVKGVYSGDAVKAGAEGVEIKTTLKKGGAVDTHGARDQWFCVFVYQVDNVTEPAADREPLRFTEVYLAQVTTADFRRNEQRSFAHLRKRRPGFSECGLSRAYRRHGAPSGTGRPDLR